MVFQSDDNIDRLGAHGCWQQERLGSFFVMETTEHGVSIENYVDGREKFYDDIDTDIPSHKNEGNFNCEWAEQTNS